MDELVVELGSDEHGFTIEGPVPAVPSSPALPVNTLLEWWADEDPDFRVFLVKTGSQWGPFGVVLRVLDADPGEVAARWQDVVEVSVELADQVSIGEIVDGTVASVAVASGSHRMRIAATGRTESADRDMSFPDDEDESNDEVALEHYLVELWPAPPSAPRVVRQESRYAADRLSPPKPEWPAERAPGLAAAWAIVRDLRGEPGSHPLPGELASLVVEVEVPGTPARVFNRVEHVFGWPPAMGGSGGGPGPGATSYWDATLPEFEGVYEQAGHVATMPLQRTKPRQVVFGWNWLLGERGTLDARPRLLPDDSLVTIDVERISAGDDARCRVSLRQDGVPAVWVEHLERLWAWHIVVNTSR